MEHGWFQWHQQPQFIKNCDLLRPQVHDSIEALLLASDHWKSTISLVLFFSPMAGRMNNTVCTLTHLMLNHWDWQEQSSEILPLNHLLQVRLLGWRASSSQCEHFYRARDTHSWMAGFDSMEVIGSSKRFFALFCDCLDPSLSLSCRGQDRIIPSPGTQLSLASQA